MTCARSALYPIRIHYAAALLEKERISHQAHAVITTNTSSVPPTTTIDGAIVDMGQCAKARSYKTTQAAIARTESNIAHITAKANALRTSLQEQRALLKEMRAKVARHKSDTESATFGLPARSASQLEQVSKITKHTRRRWNTSHEDVVRGRISLSRKAAKLAGLSKSRVVHGQSIREEYEIARGLPIPDLLRMVATDARQVTASLTAVAMLVSRVAQYLSLRLPAEIVLPGRDRPFPILYPPHASYIARQESVTQAGASSRILDQRGTRPRTLSLTKPLGKLQKEDPVAFAIFTEGIALLAWDVAWLCKSQGIAGLTTTSEISALGRNLWNLLLEDHRGTIKPVANSSHTTDDSGTNAPGPPLLFGRYSHGTAHSFMGTKEGAELVKKFPSPTRVMDKIKTQLVAELSGAEWEVIEEEHVKDAPAAEEEEPVLIGGRRWSSTNKGKSAASGWTKLHPRTDGVDTKSK